MSSHVEGILSRSVVSSYHSIVKYLSLKGKADIHIQVPTEFSVKRTTLTFLLLPVHFEFLYYGSSMPTQTRPSLVERLTYFLNQVGAAEEKVERRKRKAHQTGGVAV